MDRYQGIVRPYSYEDVKSLRDRFGIKYTLAEKSSEKFWKLLNQPEPVRALGAINGNQAMQMVRAGLSAIYCSGWQCASSNNNVGEMYPDLGLYPSNSVPMMVENINNNLRRCDQIDNLEGKNDVDWLCPIVADGEAGFGGVLNTFELTKQMIRAGAAAIHFEDQESSVRSCGHLSGKVLVPTNEFIKKLVSARLAADVLEVPTVIIARTDAESAQFITSDADRQDHEFMKSVRTPEGFYELCGDSMDRCVARGLAYAPYADLIWMETSTPSVKQAKVFAERIHEVYPEKLLAYNCSPSFHYKKFLSAEDIFKFQKELGELKYKFQFVTLAGFHSLNYGIFKLSSDYKQNYMSAYVDLQNKEFELERYGYGAVKHQHEVGVTYFDKVKQVISKNVSTLNFSNSTEKDQF